MAAKASPEAVRDLLVAATIELLAREGPSAIKARSVAAAAGLSTMAVYSHFGGVPELLNAATDHGFTQMGGVLAGVPPTDDPVADLFLMALGTRHFARANRHLYDLMFGLSTRATYRLAPGSHLRRSGQSLAFREAYRHLLDASARWVASGRTAPQRPEAVAAQLWSFVHGFVSLELADHFTEFAEPVAEVLMPLGIALCIGLGDSPERARASHERVLSQVATKSG